MSVWGAVLPLCVPECEQQLKCFFGFHSVGRTCSILRCALFSLLSNITHLFHYYMRAKIESIQVLRGVAAVAIVLTHALSMLKGYEAKYGLPKAWLNQFPLSNVTPCGVDVFFVISGFIMAMLTWASHKKKGAAVNFITKRLTRIFPAYWLWTTVIVILLLLFPFLFASQKFNFYEVIMSYLLLPYSPTGTNNSPVIVGGWTLRYEMYFYFLVFIGLFFARRHFIIGLGLLFFLTTFVIPLPSTPLGFLLSNPLLWEFYGGYLLYGLYRSGVKIPASVCIVCAFAAICMFYFFAPQRFIIGRAICWGPPAVLLVGAAVFLEQSLRLKIPHWLVYLGDSSYTLYLSHFILLPGIGRVGVMLGLHQMLPPDMQIGLYFIIAILASCILYALTERPMLALLSKKFFTQKS